MLRTVVLLILPPTLPALLRFDWSAEALRAKALIAAGEVDFDLEDVGRGGKEGKGGERGEGGGL